MECYAGEVTSMHPHYDYDSGARAMDMDLATTKAYAGPNHHSAGRTGHLDGVMRTLTDMIAGIQHGSWSMPLKPGKAPNVNWLNSNQQEIRHDLNYSTRDLEAVEDWVKRHVETTWHSLGTCSMAPKEGNSIVKHGVLDERLNVWGIKGLKVADLSVCPDNVGCNTFSTALLIGEKCAMLTAEDLGYSGQSLEMKVPNYHAPAEVVNLSRL